MITDELNLHFEKFIAKIQKVPGVDCIYFLNNNYDMIKELNTKKTDNHLDQVKNIIKAESLFSNIEKGLYQTPFHTYTLLNESGLIAISKLCLAETYYMVTIAGENEQVDLIHLLKVYKENREDVI